MSDREDANFDGEEQVARGNGQENVLETVDTGTEEKRKRTFTEKGYRYQLDVKMSNLKSKRSDLIKVTRSTLLQRGQSVDVNVFKHQLRKAQVLYAEFQDVVDEGKVFENPDENFEEIRRIVERTDREWLNFESDIRAEIEHLEFIEQQKIETGSVISTRSSHSSRKGRARSITSKLDPIGSVKGERLQLQKEEAALKVKLAFAEEEKRLKMENKRAELMNLEQQETLEELGIKSERAQNQARLNVCKLAEKDEAIESEQDLGSVPPIDKERDLDKFFRSLPSRTNIDQTPSHQYPIHSFSQVENFQPTAGPPGVDHATHSTLSPHVTPFTPQSSILEKCMDKLVETSNRLVAATMEQNLVNRQLAIAGQLPRISIPVFHGDPLQYPSWNSSFCALIDSKFMDARTKLNFLNQYVSGKPKQVVEQYILIGTEDAYQSARALLQERYGNCNVVGSAFINKLDNWPKISTRDAEALRDLSDFLQKISVARETTPSLAVLDFAKENVRILAKLPPQIQSKWRGIVQKYRVSKGDGSYPPFLQFAAFVRECAERANIPELEELPKTKEIINPEKILRVLESDFVESSASKKPYSIEDHRFLTILENGIVKKADGHYEMPLPLKSDQISLPFNRQLAFKRWHQLLARFKRNPKYLEDYRAFMRDVIALCAERVPADRLKVQDGKVNYVPHTGVYHPKKPQQIRVVFDCSAQFEGVSLNDYLLQGPDQMNTLLGILCRFRQESVAFMTDIKSMFHQFIVTEDHRDLLRFLWWEDGDPKKNVVEYRMKVHLFGATSSPGCANFGLKRAADDGENDFGREAASFKLDGFYVDDGLKSVPTVEKAVALIKASKGICAKAGLKLHKIMSNSRKVLERVPLEERAHGVKELDLDVDPLPLERALGVMWCVENDSFKFRIELRDRPSTRRGILSTVSSIYDPSGLKGKQILQQMCKDKLDWDSPLPESLRPQWEKWRQDILNLEQLEIQRCFKPQDFGQIQASELHHFSDASVEGYGQCSYLRVVNTSNQVHCSFVVGKARVVPLKQVTVPRLELTAATISVRVSEFLRQELSYKNVKEYFWTDSDIVLGYINNDAKRFHVFVANRVQQIRDLTEPSSWLHVDTEVNPADHASRGLTASQLLQGSSWLTGPEFLWESGPFQPKKTRGHPIDKNDPEVKKAHVFKTHAGGAITQSFLLFRSDRLHHISSWQRVLKAVAFCLRLKTKLLSRELKSSSHRQTSATNDKPLLKAAVTVAELQTAEKEVLKIVQREQFHEEIQVLEILKLVGEEPDRKTARQRNVAIKRSSCLYRLDPFLDEDGLIRVGGRIKRAKLPFGTKHPVVLPRKSHITALLIRFCHVKVNHMGRGITHNELRQRGYWVVGGSSAVSNCISRCVTCRKLRGCLQFQKMADLPLDRVEPSLPFSYCTVDFFGPFLIKEKRSKVKRYGVIFTCMASRSVHLEMANSLDTSSFINALCRFLNRRGPIRELRCDQGTNFVGARNELKAALKELDQERLGEYLVENGCDWIPFETNTPHSSHMGGVWERLIRTIRSALETLLLNAGTQFKRRSLQNVLDGSRMHCELQTPHYQLPE